MSIMQSLLYAVCAAALGTGAVVIVMILSPWKVLSKQTEQGQKNRYKIRQAYNNLVLEVYDVIKRFNPTYTLMVNLAASMKHKYILEDNEARIKAMELILKVIFTAVISSVLTMKYFDNSLLAIVTTLMICIYAYEVFIGDGYKFLENLEELIGEIVHVYNAENRNIDKVFQRLLADNKGYMYRYVDNMYIYLKKALMDTDNSQLIISEYNQTVPSRHLRLLFNYIYITARYGDETDAVGEQLFNKNLLAIQREVHSDLVKMKRIKEGTLGEHIFIIIAVLMIPAATWYMKEFFTFEGFETIDRFLSSSFGYAIKIICSVVALICFYIYHRIKISNTAFEKYKEVKWSEVLMTKHPWIKRFIDKIAPKPGTKKRERIENAVTLSEGYVGIRPLYIKKVIIATVTSLVVCLFLALDTFTMYNSISNDLYVGIDKTLMDTIVSLEDYQNEYKSNSLSNDRLVVDMLNKDKDYYFSLQTKDERLEYIMTLIKDNGIDYGAYPEIAAERIYEKFIQLGKVNIWVIVIVTICAFICGYLLPNLSMWLNLKLNQGAIIYDEVMGYYTVVILLINHSASNIYMILNWLANFANIFKVRLQQCIDNLSEREIKSLEEGVNYIQLSRLIECILKAYNGADLKSAFAGIEQRHMFQEEARVLINEQIIKKRIMYSQILSWTALGCTFMLYILSPMLLSIVEMLQQVI